MVDLSAGEYWDCVRLCVVSEEADTSTINQITFRDRRSRVLNRVNIHTHPTHPASDRRMYNKKQLCGRAEMSQHKKKKKLKALEWSGPTRSAKAIICLIKRDRATPRRPGRWPRFAACLDFEGVAARRRRFDVPCVILEGGCSHHTRRNKTNDKSFCLIFSRRVFSANRAEIIPQQLSLFQEVSRNE